VAAGVLIISHLLLCTRSICSISTAWCASGRRLLIVAGVYLLYGRIRGPRSGGWGGAQWRQ